MKTLAQYKIKLLGSPIHNLTMEETLNIVSQTIENQKQIHHTVVNAGKLVNMQDDAQLRESVITADLINADGQAVVWASRLLGKPLKERVSGIDLMQNLVDLADQKKYKVFFFGAKEEVVKKVVDTYIEKYNKDIIAGYRNGYFTKEEEPKIAQQITDSGADILFVAITSPIKENFLYDNREALSKVNFTMGVGGSFDVVAGKISRAPLWVQNAGLEWLHRVLQEPRRMFKRYLVGNSKFILMVMKYKLAIIKKK